MPRLGGESRVVKKRDANNKLSGDNGNAGANCYPRESVCHAAEVTLSGSAKRKGISPPQ